MRKKVLVAVVAVLVIAVMAFAGCEVDPIKSYSIPLIDLDERVIKTGDVGKNEIMLKFDEATINDAKYTEMFNKKVVVADKKDFGKDYMAHPDSIGLRRMKNGESTFAPTDEVLTMFPLGHGKGEIKGKISYDGGLSYKAEDTLTNTPKSWARSQETPTLYRLTFSADNIPDNNDILCLVSGNPSWHNDSSMKRNGFNVSLSTPSVDVATGDTVEGRAWTEFETWYGHGNDEGVDAKQIRNPQGMLKAYDAIVAMSSLTRLKDKDTHEWKNEWMGLFHDHMFNCYKTILSFRDATPEDADKYPIYSIQGKDMVMEWSEPVKYFEQYRGIQRKSDMCEVECVRSEAGMGNELCLITRSNSKRVNSLITFSSDEGETWSKPVEVPAALSGERHKAEWVKVGEADKLFITFRSIERGTNKVNKYLPSSTWMSEGYVAWVGDWDDLKSFGTKNETEGDFRVKIAHTYLGEDQKAPQRSANGDTGYCGNVVLPSGKVATCSYGMFSPASDFRRGGTTYIAGRVIDVAALYDLLALTKA